MGYNKGPYNLVAYGGYQKHVVRGAGWQSLPEDIQSAILQMADLHTPQGVRNRCRLSTVCRAWRATLSRPEFWAHAEFDLAEYACALQLAAALLAVRGRCSRGALRSLSVIFHKRWWHGMVQLMELPCHDDLVHIEVLEQLLKGCNGTARYAALLRQARMREFLRGRPYSWLSGEWVRLASEVAKSFSESITSRDSALTTLFDVGIEKAVCNEVVRQCYCIFKAFGEDPAWHNNYSPGSKARLGADSPPLLLLELQLWVSCALDVLLLCPACLLIGSVLGACYLLRPLASGGGGGRDAGGLLLRAASFAVSLALTVSMWAYAQCSLTLISELRRRGLLALSLV